MTDRGPTIDKLAQEAAEIAALDARAAFLDTRCAGDSERRAAVEARIVELLSNHVTGARPASVSVPEGVHEAATAVSPPTPLGLSRGGRVGRFRLIEILGEGGFGVVWRAEQTEPVRREVALKVIKAGMDSQAVLARFDAERQALAVMDHPSIATVLDGGATERGLPYFVMELVRGEPITEFCDKHRLSINERLELFIGVCDAVQHAHMKGVIHRDLKPSNILVIYDAEGKPQPKVIDFGIAKALSQRLTEQTIFTEQGQMIGTPEYMSPEQAEMSGLDIDTRSDVYSLGIVLYEMLTGVMPFDARTLRQASFAEIQRIIREVDPPKPSTRLGTALGTDADVRKRITAARAVDLRDLTTTLKRDLDWIVMRCLEKDRSRRYDTPTDIGDEIRRYLRHEPVLAGPPSASYRLSKFVRRNRGGVIAGSLVATALVVAVIGTTWGMLWAISERDRATLAEAAAQDRAAELELVAEFQSSQLADVDAEAMGAGMRERLLREIVASLPDADADSTAAEAEDLLGLANFTDLSLAALDEHVFERALEAIEADFDEQPLIKARLLQTVASTLEAIGVLDAAIDPQTEALEIRRRELGDAHPDTLASIAGMGALRWSEGRLGDAEHLYGEALSGSRLVRGDDDPQTLGLIADTGALLLDHGKLVEAEPFFRESLERSRRVLGDDHADTLTAIGNMGTLLESQGRLSEAAPFYREALRGSRRVLGDDDPDTLNAITNMGALLVDEGRLDEAEPYYREALAGSRRALGDDHVDTLNSMNNMGTLLLARGRFVEAEALFRESLDGGRNALGDGHPETLDSINNMGNVLSAQDRLADAEPYYRDALAGSREVLGDDHPDTLMSVRKMAVLLHRQGRFSDAAAYYTEALEGRQDVLGDDHPSTRISIADMISLHDDWHIAEPNGNHDDRATEWRAVRAAFDEDGADG